MNIKQEAYNSLLEKISELQVLVEKMTKEKESAASNLKWTTERRDKAEKSLEQLHSLLDVMDGSGPRKCEDGYSEREPMTRLAQWLASKLKIS